MRDFDYNRSLTLLETNDADGSDGAAQFEHFEFPAGEEFVKNAPTKHATRIRKERHAVEASLSEGTSDVKTMETGRIFKLHDADSLVQDQDLLAVRVETFAIAQMPEGTCLENEAFGFTPGSTTRSMAGGDDLRFESRFVALAAEIAFRPAIVTPVPRIHGVQSAIVTAEEFSGERPKINSDKLARVRVRFPWDQRRDTNDQTPTSDWIRVGQYWAGQGYGALYNPRVGHEVLVAFVHGDPERPAIITRVYNAQNVPPYDPAKDPTKSTLKSQSATGTAEVEGFNELRFEDRKKEEQIFLHAERNLDEVVLSNHTTSVGGDQSNTVGGSRTHEVSGKESVTVGGDRTTEFKANEEHEVQGARTKIVHHDESSSIFGKETTKISHHEEHTVHADGRTTNITGLEKVQIFGGARETDIAQHEQLNIHAQRKTTVDKDDDTTALNLQFTATGDHIWLFVGGDGGCAIKITPDTITLEAKAKIELKAPAIEVTATDHIELTVGGQSITIGKSGITVEGSTVTLEGSTKVECKTTGNASGVSLDGGLLTAHGETATVKAGTINLDPK